MKLAKFRRSDGQAAVGVVRNNEIVPLGTAQAAPTLTALLECEDPDAAVESWLQRGQEPLPLADVELLPPIDRQEVWAAGVTYRRSRSARMEESQGAASFYDLVYVAPRPELFFKASPHRVSGPGMAVRIRRDAGWNVPEPELALALDSRLRIVGFTVGNDVSSRDIEGENPLYLPQAKVYDACCGLGPWITLASAMPPRETVGIELVVRRAGAEAYSGRTSLLEMARGLEELVEWLGRDNSFPDGAFLLTGTGIVPTAEFTLRSGDLVEITIDGIGTLSNPVRQG